MAEPTANPLVAQLLAQRSRWAEVAGRLVPGATARRKQADEQAKLEREAAEHQKPVPFTPQEIALATIMQMPPQAEALCGLITEMIQSAAIHRRDSVASHAQMAFHEGETASLERLQNRLIKLGGQG